MMTWSGTTNDATYWFGAPLMPRPRISRAQVGEALGGIVAAGMAPAAIIIEGGRLTVQIGPADKEPEKATDPADEWLARNG